MPPAAPRVADDEAVERNARRCAERGVVLPTFAQMRDPARLVPDETKARLRAVGLWDVDAANLFRLTWHNEPVDSGGLFRDGVNTLALPPSLTGVPAPVVGLVGKWFPTGAHKAGAAYGVLVQQLVTGAFDATRQQAVWPSTGNYCRGGAFDSALLGVDSVAVLPEEMSAERFEWLRGLGGEVLTTPGGESNVKEIYDRCHELRRERGDRVHVFNQFAEMGNPFWHYHVTGPAFAEAFAQHAGPRSRLAAFVSATGSAGTIAAGDYLRTLHPRLDVVAVEAEQCPTLSANGHGEHRIEGIGDKHVPWVHNVRNTDAVVTVDDEAAVSVWRLFNEPEGHAALLRRGVPADVVGRLPLLGISCVCNALAAIKAARRFEYGGEDVVLVPFTDSAAMYKSRLAEMDEQRGPFTALDAERTIARFLDGGTDAGVTELTYSSRKRLHNLKHFTWVEQQGMEPAELAAQWTPQYWDRVWGSSDEWDRLIDSFNARVRRHM